MKRASFLIGPQAFTIVNPSQDNLKWLRALSQHVPESHLYIGCIVDATINFGSFSYNQFREFMSKVGYKGNVFKADLNCLNSKV